MNYRLSLPLFLLLSCSFPHSAHPSAIQTVEDYIDTAEEFFEEKFENLQKKLNNFRKNWREEMGIDRFHVIQTSLSEAADHQGLVIKVTNLQLKDATFDASYDHDDNTLSVNTSEGVVSVRANGRYISVGFSKYSQEQKKVAEKAAAAIMSITSQTSRTLPHELLLDKASIEYDQTNQALLITVPYKLKPKNVTKIDVRLTEGQSAQAA